MNYVGIEHVRIFSSRASLPTGKAVSVDLLLGWSQLRRRAVTLRARSARDQVRKSPSTSAT